MVGFRRSSLIALVAAVVAGCSHPQTVKRLGVDYNRAMAEARDEQLLTNIVRASAREPLMFSAIGEVTATVSRKGSLSTVFTNLITGGNDVISPTLALEAATTPVVKVTPLSSKEFTEGILRPMKPETLNHFIGQGWDTEFLLPLVLAGYRCPNSDDLVLFGGQEGTVDVTAMTAPLNTFALRESSTSKDDVTLTVSDAEALEMMRTAVAGDYKVKSVSPFRDRRGHAVAGRSVVVLGGPESKAWKANPPLSPEECAGQDKANYDLEGGKAGVLLRSVEGIIYFLGAAFRPCFLGQQSDCSISYDKAVVDQSQIDCLRRHEGKSVAMNQKVARTLFRIRSGPNSPPGAAISTRYHGVDYWVDRLDRCDMDRSLKTLSFLSQLIALQTNVSDLAVTPSVISVNP